MMPEFPFDDCHMRLLIGGICHDTTRATFQTHPYRGQNRRYVRKSNTTTAWVRYAPQAQSRPPAQEDLGFHPALAYKYSGERGACKGVCSFNDEARMTNAE